MIQKAKIKWYNIEKGYGFIELKLDLFFYEEKFK